MKQEVQDRSAEASIKLNNVLTFMVLSVMSWVGYNIENIKDGFSDLNKVVAVQSNELAHIKSQLQNHIDKKNTHTRHP